MADERFTAPPLLLHTQERWLNAGEETLVTFRWSESMTLEGWQLSLDANPALLQILDVEGLPADQFSLQGPQLKALWADGAGRHFDPETAVFTLKVKALQGTHLSEALSMNAERLRPEAYSGGAQAATERHPLFLHFGENTAASVHLFAPRPNPFDTETTFELLLENPDVALLEVFDLNGRRLFSERYDMETGYQQLRLPASVLPGKGVYVYRLSVGETSAQGRLLRL